MFQRVSLVVFLYQIYSVCGNIAITFIHKHTQAKVCVKEMYLCTYVLGMYLGMYLYVYAGVTGLCLLVITLKVKSHLWQGFIFISS